MCEGGGKAFAPSLSTKLTARSACLLPFGFGAVLPLLGGDEALGLIIGNAANLSDLNGHAGSEGILHAYHSVSSMCVVYMVGGFIP